MLAAQAALATATVAALQTGLCRPWPFYEMPHNLLSVALGLLLVHRVTHSYDRFWSGRRHWQRLCDECRTLCRRAVTWCAGDDGGRDIAAHALLLVAATEARLGGSGKLTFTASLSSLVPRATMVRVEASAHPPLTCSDELGRRIAQCEAASELSAERALELERSLQEMMRCAGECDAIARTPTPYEYSAHTSRFLTLVRIIPLVSFCMKADSLSW